MAHNREKVFTLKTYGSALYKWSPIPADTDKHKRKGSKKPYYCDAKAGSQGEDWIVTYVYDKVITSGQEHRYAYVECGYVK